ncbi:MAG TPA: hypothetical protein VLG50_02860 [Candidatus Saccharimonadales bacterium]|nr:hypothetical protein [Candidatus Saccharimonadales bacterium]
MKNIYICIVSICILSSTVHTKHKELKPAIPPTIQDLGYMFHDGTDTRPYTHLTHGQLQTTVAYNIPSDTVITAETDDVSPDSNKQSHIAIILYDPTAQGWFVDYAIINPESSGRFATLNQAQLFALDFLKSPSTKNIAEKDRRRAQKELLLRDKAIKQDAARRKIKRKQLANTKHTMV